MHACADKCISVVILQEPQATVSAIIQFARGLPVKVSSDVCLIDSYWLEPHDTELHMIKRWMFSVFNSFAILGK